MSDTCQAQQHLLQLRQRLMETLREEQWEKVAAGAPRYLAAMEQMIARYQQASIPDEKAALALVLQETQIAQAEIIGRLRARLSQLEQSRVQIQRGKSGCQSYAEQLPGRFD